MSIKKLSILILLGGFFLFLIPGKSLAINCPPNDPSCSFVPPATPTPKLVTVPVNGPQDPGNNNTGDPTTSTYTPTTSTSTVSVPDGTWLPDDEVTFAGKSASRSASFFGWTLSEYQWAGSDRTTLSQFWGQVRNIIFEILLLVIVATSFAILFTRGKSVGVFQFLRRFLIVVLVILFSFAIIQFIYQVTDILQSFFLNIGTKPISVSDLLNVSINYTDFVGYRRVGGAYEESAFIALLLVKLTAITYNTIAALLVVRKVIMWFFLVISPLFPLLILYYPLRNTAKIWIAEFFRWVLYAPLFMVCLSGLVALWRSNIVLLPFSTDTADVYPVAINILLGGPGQNVTTNSLQTNGAYAEYVVALLMLWVVILLPFLLLRVFLDYVASLSIENINSGSLSLSNLPLTNKFFGTLSGNGGAPAGTPGRTQPISVAGEGVRTVPLAPVNLSPTIQRQDILQPSIGTTLRGETIAPIRGEGVSVATSTSVSAQSSSSPVLNRTNLTPSLTPEVSVRAGATVTQRKNLTSYGLPSVAVPTIRDIARYDRALTSSSPVMREEVSHIQQELLKVGAPEKIVSGQERQNYTNAAGNLIAAQQRGDQVAAAVIGAAHEVARMTTGGKQSENVIEKNAGSPSFTKIPVALPIENKVQQVNLDDFDAVRDLWKDQYTNAQPPEDMTRTQWLTKEQDKTNEAVKLLQSSDSEDNKKGLKIVSELLPFLLAGGFSKSEIISYLLSKMKAAAEVLTKLHAPSDGEEKKDQSEVPSQQTQSQAKQVGGE